MTRWWWRRLGDGTRPRRRSSDAPGEDRRIFTGLIARLGTVREVEAQPHGGMRLTVDARTPLAAKRGDSIAVNGVCLTIADGSGALTFDVVPETIERSNLGDLRAGDAVNLETSLRAGDEIGGHLVYGHVDATTVLLSKQQEGGGARIWCVTPPSLRRFIAEKGSIALDGVSLTIASVRAGEFSVALIPETLERTTLGAKDAGSVLNIEADPVARYVVHALATEDRA